MIPYCEEGGRRRERSERKLEDRGGAGLERVEEGRGQAGEEVRIGRGERLRV